MSPVLLAVSDLRVCLPRRATPSIDGLNFELGAGECLALVGASGSGKSLTSAALLGVLPKGAIATGSVRLAGTELIGADAAIWRRARAQDIGMVWQDAQASLHPQKSIGLQLSEVLCNAGTLSRRAARLRAVELLAEVGIERPLQYLDAFAHQLSGGQRQRAMIALALAGAPRLLIADEATSALDTTVQAQVVALLDRLRREHALALLFISHDLPLVRGIADRVAVLEQGRLVELAVTDELFSAPRHAASIALLGARRTAVRAILDPRQPAEPLLRLENLNASFAARGAWLHKRRDSTLRGIGFCLERGKTLAVVGESGSGKSTLARCLLGLKRADRGQLHLDSSVVDLAGTADFTALRRQLQIVFQDPFASLDPLMRIRDIVAEPLRLAVPRHASADIGARVASLLHDVGLEAALAERYPHTLSGGQRQRVAIARALAAAPRCLVLDEATSALDAIVQTQILALLRQLQAERGLALLFITHDLALAAELADQIAVLWRGELVEIGDAAEVLARPRHAHTRDLLVARPLVCV